MQHHVADVVGGPGGGNADPQRDRAGQRRPGSVRRPAIRAVGDPVFPVAAVEIGCRDEFDGGLELRECQGPAAFLSLGLREQQASPSAESQIITFRFWRMASTRAVCRVAITWLLAAPRRFWLSRVSKDGNAIASRIASTATVTASSISVKPAALRAASGHAPLRRFQPIALSTA
jgi:hypothetical protein